MSPLKEYKHPNENKKKCALPIIESEKKLAY